MRRFMCVYVYCVPIIVDTQGWSLDLRRETENNSIHAVLNMKV